MNSMKTDKAVPTFKNLIIWRHAEAYPALAQGEDQDLARKLTPKGKQQAKRMARWLSERLPNDVVLLSSPAMRAFQTAQALKGEVEVLESLKPSTNLQEVLAALNILSASASNLLLVGHQPWLWQLVAHLTNFTAQEISIKKGAVWWLRLSDDDMDASAARYTVAAVQSPGLLD